jgi:hypothetical protein
MHGKVRPDYLASDVTRFEVPQPFLVGLCRKCMDVCSGQMTHLDESKHRVTAAIEAGIR